MTRSTAGLRGQLGLDDPAGPGIGGKLGAALFGSPARAVSAAEIANLGMRSADRWRCAECGDTDADPKGHVCPEWDGKQYAFGRDRSLLGEHHHPLGDSRSCLGCAPCSCMYAGFECVETKGAPRGNPWCRACGRRIDVVVGVDLVMGPVQPGTLVTGPERPVCFSKGRQSGKTKSVKALAEAHGGVVVSPAPRAFAIGDRVRTRNHPEGTGVVVSTSTSAGVQFCGVMLDGHPLPMSFGACVLELLPTPCPNDCPGGSLALYRDNACSCTTDQRWCVLCNYCWRPTPCASGVCKDEPCQKAHAADKERYREAIEKGDFRHRPHTKETVLADLRQGARVAQFSKGAQIAYFAAPSKGKAHEVGQLPMREVYYDAELDAIARALNDEHEGPPPCAPLAYGGLGS